MKKLIEKLIETLSSAMHDAWRKEVGPEPQLRPDRDDAGNKVGDPTININVPFEGLTPGWRKYNSQAAQKYVAAFVELDFTENVEELSSAIHDLWIIDNEWQKADKPELFVSFKELSPEEAEKDRVYARLIINTYKNLTKEEA